MDILKKRLGSDNITELNEDMIALTLIRGRKPILCDRTREHVLDGLLRCAERSDIPLELVAAVYVLICYST